MANKGKLHFSEKFSAQVVYYFSGWHLPDVEVQNR
jgi:hypothetical protein